MNLFVYVVRHDSGFAPNPFFGYCTLATCKPGIRKSAQKGDWIAGVGSKQKGQTGKLVYAMKVEEMMSFDTYWDDSRFLVKRPHLSGSLKLRNGDNIYHRPTVCDSWIQEDGCHSNDDGSPNYDHIERDTSISRVLISQEFVYYGKSAVDIPVKFLNWGDKDMFVGVRGYRCHFPRELQDRFIEWVQSLLFGDRLVGDPLDW